jgi:hypothetical protein
VKLWARKNRREFCRKWRLPRHFWVLLHAVNLRHGTDGFTSPEDFFARKIRRLRPGLNPRTWVPNASTLTSRPPKPLLGFLLNNPYFNILLNGIAQLHGVIFQTSGLLRQSVFMFLTLSNPPIKITAAQRFGIPAFC